MGQEGESDEAPEDAHDLEELYDASWAPAHAEEGVFGGTPYRSSTAAYAADPGGPGTTRASS